MHVSICFPVQKKSFKKNIKRKSCKIKFLKQLKCEIIILQLRTWAGLKLQDTAHLLGEMGGGG